MLGLGQGKTVRNQRYMRVLCALVLAGVVAASGSLSPSHPFNQLVRPARAEVLADGENCQPGSGYGLVPDHARQVEPDHVCVVCKVFKGALPVNARLNVPLFTPAFTAALSRGATPHFTGFYRFSRSPPFIA